ncbi:hypothetical protein [Amycolatopsis kentuckyensis]|uniref:hypothetical protein n=1 Tax=Amycolatopsis kentuckyensis TaxID=218823 RepID=UPI00356428C5
MTTVDEWSTRGQRTAVYVVVGVVLGALLVAGYLLHRSAREAAAAICADPAAALVRATGDPGTRPALPAGTVVRGQSRVIAAHCPEKLAAYWDHVGELGFVAATGG